MKVFGVGRVVPSAPLSIGRALRRVRDNAPYLLALLAFTQLRADTQWTVATDNVSGVTIRLNSPLTAVPRFGFLPLRVWIENTTARDGQWRFDFAVGHRLSATGELATSLEVAVPAKNNREVWVFVPLAENGLDTTPVALRASTASPVPTSPPNIAGVFPAPAGVNSSVSPGRITASGMNFTREFTITQTGPAALLPMLTADKLPVGATLTVTPAGAGTVTRVTRVIVTSPMTTFSSTATSILRSPANIARENAQKKLADAGLNQGRTTMPSSRTTPVGAKPGEQLVTLTIFQHGPPSLLSSVPPGKLPPGFTSVDLRPNGSVPGEVVRSFEYTESVPNPTVGTTSISGSGAGTLTLGGSTSAGGGTLTFSPGTMAVGTGSSPSTAQADARRVLDPTGLLKVPSTVRTATTNQILFPAGGGSMSYFTVFVQTGPALALPPEPASRWPPGVVVNLHVADIAGEIVRTISYLDPAVHAAWQASSTAASASGNPFNASRLDLQRWGFLRPSTNISVSSSSRGVGPSGPTTIIHSENGPAALLPQPVKEQLPPGVTATITPGPIPGEVSRNFIVTPAPPPTAATVGGARPTISFTSSSSLSRSSARAAIGARTVSSPPPNFAVVVSGPGISGGSTHLLFNTRLEANSATPPIALAAPLEAAFRSAISTSGLSGSPSVAPIDFAAVPADWRTWSSLHTVILRDADWEALSGAHRAALRTWAALGGQVVVVPEEAGEERGERGEPVGLGAIRFLRKKIADYEPTEFREHLHLASLPPSLPDRSSLRFPEKSALGAILGGADDGNTWLAVFLVLFAIGIGPVNLFFLAPPGRRHRLFVTVPLLSLAGAGVLAATIVMKDGFGGEGERRTLVILVPGDNLASIVQEQAVLTGFVTQRDFALADDCIATLVPDKPAYIINRAGPNPTGAARTELVRRAGRADGDWFRNRWRQAQHVRWAAPTRMRVEFTGTTAGGAPIVESTLGATLRDFLYADAAGVVWSAAEVPPGQRVPLTRGGNWPAGFVTGGTACLDQLTLLVSTCAPGRWIARGGGTDLAPLPALAGLRWTTDEVRYAGIATGAALAAAPGGGGGAP